MRVGRFIKRLINPETDQAGDRLETLVSEIEDASTPARGNDNDPTVGALATEEELRAAGIDPVALHANENWEKVTPLKPDPDSESGDEEPEAEHETGPTPRPEPEPEASAPVVQAQRSEPGNDRPVAPDAQTGENLPAEAREPVPAPATPGPAAVAPSTTDDLSLAQSAVDSGFIITLAQELSAPITSLKVSYELLKDPEHVGTNPAETKRLMENVERSISRLERQTSDLLEVGYLRTGSLKLVTQPIDLTEPILAAIDISRPEAVQRQVAIELDLQPELPMVIADGYRLTQVITHLLSNAIKFTPVDGSVVLTVETGFSDLGFGAESRQKNEEPAPDVIIARVVDNGPGIREAHIDLIFEPFYRISGEGTEGAAGVGLGLAIVKGLVELHNGTVWVKSTAGEATEFGFSIPIA